MAAQFPGRYHAYQGPTDAYGQPIENGSAPFPGRYRTYQGPTNAYGQPLPPAPVEFPGRYHDFSAQGGMNTYGQPQGRYHTFSSRGGMSTYGNTGYDQLPADITVPYVTAVTANSLTGSKSAKSAKSSNKKSVNGASKKAAKSTAKTTSTPLVTSGAGQRQVLIDATGQLPPILISSGAPNPLEAARQQALQEVLAAIPAGAQQYIPGSASDPYMNTPGYQGVPYAGNAQVYGGSTIGTDPNAVTLGTPVGAGQPAGPQYYAPVIASRILNAWQDPNMSGNMTQANIDFLRNLT